MYINTTFYIDSAKYGWGPGKKGFRYLWAKWLSVDKLDLWPADEPIESMYYIPPGTSFEKACAIDVFIKIHERQAIGLQRYLWFEECAETELTPDCPGLYWLNATWFLWKVNETRVYDGKTYELAFEPDIACEEEITIFELFKKNFTKCQWWSFCVNVSTGFDLVGDEWKKIIWDENIVTNVETLEEVPPQAFHVIDVFGTDVVGVYGGFFDRFMNLTGNYTGTTLLKEGVDVTPTEEKDLYCANIPG